MKIINPATGAALIDVVADTAKTVREKYARARAAQPKWAATPIRKRLAAIGKFREILVDATPSSRARCRSRSASRSGSRATN
jgi:acyl-CoA reductase-like NAD-dependent aldehyde dehydrogenase